jgi:hypothetical protein
MAVRDQNGNVLGTIFETHDGTDDGMRSAGERLTARASAEFHDFSNIASLTMATDDGGTPRHVISPNRNHIAPTTSDEAKYIWGNLDYAPGKTRELKPASPTVRPPAAIAATPTAVPPAARPAPVTESPEIASARAEVERLWQRMAAAEQGSPAESAAKRKLVQAKQRLSQLTTPPQT